MPCLRHDDHVLAVWLTIRTIFVTYSNLIKIKYVSCCDGRYMVSGERDDVQTEKNWVCDWMSTRKGQELAWTSNKRLVSMYKVQGAINLFNSTLKQWCDFSLIFLPSCSYLWTLLSLMSQRGYNYLSHPQYGLFVGVWS